MSPQKLAVLLTAMATVGQFTILAIHSSAEANSQTQNFSLPYASDVIVSSSSFSVGKPLEVASVIGRPEPITSIAPANPKPLEQPSVSPGEIYTIKPQAGGLKTVIQVLPHSTDNVSLYVNGSEILRIRGLNAEGRVKATAKALHQQLSANMASAATIEPSQQAFMMGATRLGTVDAVSATALRETPERLAYQYANRLRKALGQSELTSPMPALPASEVATTAPTQNTEISKAVVATKSTSSKYKSLGKRQAGVASWYGGRFHGRRTASGARFNQYALTAAHRTLPFGTLVRVVNQKNHQSCVVKITDRGPYAHGRIIDLSKGAAQAIHMSGTAKVALELVAKG